MRACRDDGWTPVSEFRVGTGFDAHALEDGVPLVLGGVRVESDARARRAFRRRRDHPRADRRPPRRRQPRRHRLSLPVRRPHAARHLVARSSGAGLHAGARGGVGARQRRLRLHRSGAAARTAPRRDVRRARGRARRRRPSRSPSARRPRTGSGSPGAARGSLRRPSHCFVGPRERGAQSVLEPVEREVELLRRVVEVLVDLGDRALQRRESQRRTFRSPSFVTSSRVGPPVVGIADGA